MRKSKPLFRKRACSAGPLLAVAVAGLAAMRILGQPISVTYNLNTAPDPSQFDLVGSAEWMDSGGVGNSGYIKLTDNTGQSCAVLFPDFAPGFVTAAFEFECMIKLGDWGTGAPADGFSVNYASANDPIIDLIANGTNPGRGGRTDGWAGSFDNGGDEDNLPEEGTKTGIGIGFDTWGTGSAPVGGSNGASDVRGISVRVDGKQLTQIAMPNVAFAEGYDYENDATTLITGPATPDNPQPATGERLKWVPLKVTVNELGIVNVWWKNRQIVTNLATTFSPMPGRILFGASTGGAYEFAGIDDIKVTVYPSSTLLIGTASGTPIGFTVTVSDSGPAIADPNTVVLKLDGNPVTPKTVEKPGSTTTISWYDAAAPMVAGSVHKVYVSIKDTRGNAVEGEREFTVPSYIAIPAEWATTVDTSKQGFKVRVHQVPPESAWGFPNTIARAEQQLYGFLGANAISPADFIESVINFADGTNAGAFGDDSFIPGTSEALDNMAAEIVAYLYFPEAGVYNVYFNSDDGFRTTAFKNPKEVLGSTIISEFDGGRGAADSVAKLYIPAPGYYPFRTVWFEGAGGANFEWSADREMPNKAARALINAGGAPVMAFYEATSALPPAVSFINPVRNSGNPYMPDIVITAEIQDGTDAVDQGSVKLALDGAAVTPTVTKSGAITKVTYDPPGNLPGGTHTIGLEFAAGGTTYTRTNSFTVRTAPVIPPSFALPASVVDKNKTGFLVRTFQHDTGRGNSTLEGEMQLAGLYGWPNTADLSLFTVDSKYGKYYEEPWVINYVAPDGGGAGSFGDDVNPPGIPGTASSGSGTDNYAVEILTVLDLKAGLYIMNVNSDDGFRVTVGGPEGNMVAPLVLGEFNGGRGADADQSWFAFEVAQAGLYPFRLLWYEGGGGSSCEWMTGAWDKNTSIIKTSNDYRRLVNDVMNYTDAVPAYQYPINSKGVPYVKWIAPGRAGSFSGYNPGNYYSGSFTSGARPGPDVTLKACIVDGETAVTPADVELWLDGAKVAATITKSGNETTVSYKPPTDLAVGRHNAELRFAGRTIPWPFDVVEMKTPVFYIEAADFDYDGGKHKPEASVMPYAGGAYAGLSAVHNVDYFRTYDDGDNPWYRVGESPQQPVSVANDRERGAGVVQCEFRLGWMGGGHWYNYTRNFPQGKYAVYAALSHGGTDASNLNGELAIVQGGTPNKVGTFLAPGTGEWGRNNLVPLKDSVGGIVPLDLGGTQTLRFTSLDGDFDYLVFVPYQETAPPQFTSIKVNANGSITVEWTGGGTLQATTSLTEPNWQDVPGATSPFTFTPTEKMLFGRIKR